jgi:predicted acylesterase/phospholipase RssA
MLKGKPKKITESDSVAQEANTTTVKPPPVAAKSALKKSNSLVDSGVEKKKVVIQSPDPNDGLLKKQTISFMEDVPLNILCLDGGGTKCYSTLAMMEEIEAISEREGIENRDFLSRFDLIVGTSIGGVLALIVNKTAST